MDQKFPTEFVELPSQGRLYSSDSALSNGKVEIKYMSAKEEDILTNQNFIQQGVVGDKLLKALVVTPFNLDDLLIADKNAILIAARILGYGKEYEFEYGGEKQMVDLSLLESKPLHTAFLNAASNEFPFELPASGIQVTFRLLTHGDEEKITQEVKALKKVYKDSSPEASTRLKYTLLSIDGVADRAAIRQFVDQGQLLARDARALRNYIREIQPGVDLRFYPEDGPDGGVDLPIGTTFFWPDSRV